MAAIRETRDGPRTRERRRRQGEGRYQETAGKVTGDKELELEGKLDKARGDVHNAAGNVERRCSQSDEIVTPLNQIERPRSVWSGAFLWIIRYEQAAQKRRTGNKAAGAGREARTC